GAAAVSGILAMPLEVAVLRAAQRIEAHLEPGAGLLDLEVADLRNRRAPVSVAHHERDRTDGLRFADLDPAQLTILQGGGHGPGGQKSPLRYRFVGAEQFDAAVGHWFLLRHAL